MRRGKRLALWGALALGAVLIATIYVCRDHLLVTYWVWRYPNTLLAALLSPSASDQEILDRSQLLLLSYGKSSSLGDWRNPNSSALLQDVGVEPEFAGKLQRVRGLRIADLGPLKAGLSTARGARRLLLGRVLAVAGMPREFLDGSISFSSGSLRTTGTLRIDAAELVAMAEWLQEARPEARRAAAGALVLAAIRPLFFQWFAASGAQMEDELKVAYQQVQPLLQPAAQDGDTVLRSRATLALYIIGALIHSGGDTTRVPPDALPCLDDEEPFVRQSAALWCFFRSAEAERAAGAIAATLDDAWLGRREAAAILREKPEPALAACRKLLPHADKKTAQGAAICLKLLADWEVPGAGEALVPATPALTAAAEQALREMTPWRGVKPDIQEAIDSMVRKMLEPLRERP